MFLSGLLYSEKSYHENMYKMQCGDKEVFRNFFIFGNPKFVSPCSPASDAVIADYSKEATDHQINVGYTQTHACILFSTQRFSLVLSYGGHRCSWKRSNSRCSCLPFVLT